MATSAEIQGQESMAAAAKNFAANWHNLNENFFDQLLTCCQIRSNKGGWGFEQFFKPDAEVEREPEDKLTDARGSERGTEAGDVTDWESGSQSSTSTPPGRSTPELLSASMTADAIEHAL